jgi:hypothetical protein
MASSDPASNTRPALSHRIGILIVAVLLLSVAALLPFASLSLFTTVTNPQYEKAIPLVGGGVPMLANHVQVHLDAVSMDEWAGTITFRVSGAQECNDGCTWNDRLLFVSIPDTGTVVGLPPSTR